MAPWVDLSGGRISLRKCSRLKATSGENLCKLLFPSRSSKGAGCSGVSLVLLHLFIMSSKLYPLVNKWIIENLPSDERLTSVIQKVMEIGCEEVERQHGPEGCLDLPWSVIVIS